MVSILALEKSCWWSCPGRFRKRRQYFRKISFSLGLTKLIQENMVLSLLTSARHLSNMNSYVWPTIHWTGARRVCGTGTITKSTKSELYNGHVWEIRVGKDLVAQIPGKISISLDFQYIEGKHSSCIFRDCLGRLNTPMTKTLNVPGDNASNNDCFLTEWRIMDCPALQINYDVFAIYLFLPSRIC